MYIYIYIYKIMCDTIPLDNPKIYIHPALPYITEANWKSPGPDRLPNLWIKLFKSLHKPMAEAYSEIIKDPKQTPDWLVEGATNLPCKKEETQIPKNHRPITYLPTTFKILTSVITDRLYSHLEKEAIMKPEQRGGKKDCYGCKDQLMINNAILENCKKRKKNLSTAWIDYKKALAVYPIPGYSNASRCTRSTQYL